MSEHPLAAPEEPRRLILGIDPGSADGEATLGLCLLDPRERADRGGMTLQTLDLPGALETITAGAEDPPGIAVAVVEDARALPIYARHDGVRGRARDRLARSVGRIDGATSTVVALLARLGIPYVLREPAKAGKWDAGAFARMTGYTAPTTQHERDAARLVYGYTAGALVREAARQRDAERTPSPPTATAP